MLDKLCPTCEQPFEDGDDVVAIMLSKYKKIPSEVNFAIYQPTECIEIVHSDCFDYEDDIEDDGGEIDN